MSNYYYNVSYIEYENGQVSNNDRMLIQSTDAMTIERIKSFIRRQINKPSAVITLVEVTPIDKETYIMLGGPETPPWISGGKK
jgi:hypothetical protein